MKPGICASCGATLDWNGRCDCGGTAPMDAQQRIDAEREVWLRRSGPEAKVGAALYALRRGVGTVRIIDYTRYKNARQVPEAELVPLVHALRAEKRRQDALGVEKHQALRGLGAKIAECRRVLDDLELELYQAGRLGENSTWDAFYQLVDAQMLGESANTEPAPPKEPETAPDQVTLSEVMNGDRVHKTG